VWRALQSRLIESAKDVGVGGIAIALYKWSCISNRGVQCQIPLSKPIELFSESLHRAFVEVKPENREEFERELGKIGVKWQLVGKVGGDKIEVNQISILLSEAKELYFGTFPKLMASETL
ncbi:MAG: AIR synthase-related protein, partial [Campylobacterales bacterium]